MIPFIPAIGAALGAGEALFGGGGGGGQSAEEKAAAEADKKRRSLEAQYGGVDGGAALAVARQQGQSEKYVNQGIAGQNRQGVQVGYGQANQDYAQQQQARGGQSALASAMYNRAMGNAPSIAQMEANRQSAIMQAQQASAAASARGPAGLAMAQQSAAANTAAGQGAIAGQAQIATAQERLAAEQAASAAYGQMRGNDLGSMQQSAQQAQYQANLDAQQRAQNDQYQLGLGGLALGHENAGVNIGTAQMQNYTNREQDSTNRWKAQMDTDQRSKKDSQELGMGILKTVMGGAGAASMSDERAKTNIHEVMLSDVAAKNVGMNGLLGQVGIGTLGASSLLSDSRAKQDAFNAGAEFGGLAKAMQSKGPMEQQAAQERVPGGDPMSRALSTLKPYEYEYKPGMGEAPGRQVGPMANNMAQDPIAAQTVKQDPGSGLLMVDKDRALKLSLAGNGYLNNKVQEQQAQLDALSRAMGQPSSMEQMAKKTRGK